MVSCCEPEGSMTAVAIACLLESALLVAVTYTFVTAFTTGAVKLPLLVMEPAEADQVTPVLSVPDTVAVNDCIPLEATLTLDGLTLTWIPPWPGEIEIPKF